ncbi:MAG: cytochrome b/b6 domain-containing protein [Acidobacteriota bacterium]
MEKIDTKGLEGIIDDDEIFERMPLSQRVQHIILAGSFILLILTGFPLLFPEMKVMRYIFFFQYSFWVRGLLHRIAAMFLIGVSVYHIFYIVFSEEGNRFAKEMMPKPKDIYDASALFMHNIGLISFLHRKGILKSFLDRHQQFLFNERPKFGKYNFIEKFEYMAVVWGNIIMITTGFFLWFEETSIALFPKFVLDIIRVIHGFEAILAFLAIIIWHMYNVHLNPEAFPMSWIWLNGQISGRDLKHHHPLEYERIARERLQMKKASEQAANLISSEKPR